MHMVHADARLMYAYPGDMHREISMKTIPKAKMAT